LKLVQARG
jgi:hypothetical protein